jgi:DASS family divalent anion:Na+ symporter
MNKTHKNWLITIAVGVVLWFIPGPAGIDPAAWKMFAVFTATIIGFILQPIPMGALAILSLVVTGFLGLAKLGELLTGFANSTVWLVVSAFMISCGFRKTGLGRRVAYVLIERFGKNTLNLGYAITASEFIFCPATPSSAARGGAVLYPVVRSLASAFKSEPGESAQRIGAYLMQVGFQSNCMSGALFLTAMVGNPLCLAFAQQAFGITITWAGWAVAALVPGTIAMIAIPLVMYYINPPEIKRTPEARELARAELEKMGPMTRNEKIMMTVFVVSIMLWATSQYTKIDATLVALGGAASLLVTSAITWQDVLDEKGAWDTMIWIGGLVTMAGLLSKYGLIAWVSKNIAVSLVGIPWMTTLILILIFHFYSHYFFASLTAHTTALYPALIAVAASAGAPPMLVALSMGFFNNFCACLTHYGNGVAPIYFGAGYMSQGKWWKLGFMMSIVYMIIWIGIGFPWWKVIGLW